MATLFGAGELAALPAEQRELLLDAGQFTLDLIGCFEPTPFADLTSGVVSLVRGEIGNAVLSGIGIIPYAGDLAKAAKLPKYVRSVERAVGVARGDARFRAVLQPVLDRLLAALQRLPLDRLPVTLREPLDRLQRVLVDFLPGGGRMASRLDFLTEDMLRRVFGSTSNVGVLPRQNMRTIVEFFDAHRVGNGNPAEWAELVRGIDLHAAEPVKVISLRRGEIVAEYVETSRPAGRQIGQWMVRAQGGVSHRNLGLSGSGRVRKVFRVRQDVQVLKSKAAGAADHWTAASGAPHTAVTVRDGHRVMTAAEQVAGGGDQYFLPRAWEFLDAVL
jgi:hypothetical protein